MSRPARAFIAVERYSPILEEELGGGFAPACSSDPPISLSGLFAGRLRLSRNEQRRRRVFSALLTTMLLLRVDGRGSLRECWRVVDEERKGKASYNVKGI